VCVPAPGPPLDRAKILAIWIARARILGGCIYRRWDEILAVQEPSRKEKLHMDGERLITIHEAVERLAISERTFQRWVIKKGIPFIRIGHLVRYRWSDIERALQASTFIRMAKPAVPLPQAAEQSRSHCGREGP
jgi:excisionase family DNA binding protein